MPSRPSLPGRVSTPADIAAIDAAARIAHTSCGGGTVVWRIWNEATADAASDDPRRRRTPVVLLHGGSGSWNHWVRNIAALVNAGHVVHAPDLPGCGDSGPLPFGNDADAIAPWIESGLVELIGERQIRLVAFSFGAMVGTLLAAAVPARVERLVIVGAPGLKAQALRSLRLRAWNHLPAGPERDSIIRDNLRILMVARDETMDDTALQMHIGNLLRDRLHGRRLSQTDIIKQTLPRVTCPLYGIWGASDALYSDRQDIIEPALAAAPQFRSLTMIAGAGHWVQYEDAEAFNEVLIGVLG
jgi:2-hydroxy-6-oxonona-2,4-dienedioate hydrolase